MDSMQAVLSILSVGSERCRRPVATPLLLLTLAVGGIGPALAQSEKSEDDWQFRLSPLFLWGMGISGRTAIGPAAAPLDVEFKDALDNLNGVFTFHFEAQKEKLGLFAEYLYVDMRPTAELSNGSSVYVDFESKMAELGATYRVAEFSKGELQILGGARYMQQHLRVSGIPVPPLSSLSNKENWWDAIVGVRAMSSLSENWTVSGRVDYGFGGSNGTWNLAGTFDYRFRGWGSVFVGYRWMDIDYSSGSGKDRFVYDAKQRGPLAGITFHW